MWLDDRAQRDLCEPKDIVKLVFQPLMKLLWEALADLPCSPASGNDKIEDNIRSTLNIAFFFRFDCVIRDSLIGSFNI